MHVRKMVIAVLLTGIVATLVACANYKAVPLKKSGPATQQLVLDYIRLEKPATQDDKLYINIATYSSTSGDSDYQIPEAPLHWDANYLEQVKDIVLWEKGMDDPEQMDIVLSLIENDIPPWDPDDLLGTVKLTIHAQNQHITAQWHADEDAVALTPRNHQLHEYILVGDHGRYVIGLRLKQKG